MTFPLWENYDCENWLVSIVRIASFQCGRLRTDGSPGLPPNTPRVPSSLKETAEICLKRTYIGGWRVSNIVLMAIVGIVIIMRSVAAV